MTEWGGVGTEGRSADRGHVLAGLQDKKAFLWLQTGGHGRKVTATQVIWGPGGIPTRLERGAVV